jgi:hypothetical protein
LKPPPISSNVKHTPNPQPATTQYQSVPKEIVSPAIPQTRLVVPPSGYLEPFPTIHNMREIANRIRATTFGQICAVPGANVKTKTEPPREALVYPEDYIIAYALHLLNVIAFSMSHETTLEYKAATGNEPTSGLQFDQTLFHTSSTDIIRLVA